MHSFLVQVNTPEGHVDITKNQRYVNPNWMDRRRDRHHGMVKPGDRLFVYCGSKVSHGAHKQLLAFSVDVKTVSTDNTTFELGELQWFRRPLKRTTILEYVEQGELADTFRNCSAQGFNIIKLEPDVTKQILALVEFRDTNTEDSLNARIVDLELSEFRQRWYQAYLKRFEAAKEADLDDWLIHLRRKAPQALANLDELARSDDLGVFVESMQKYSREETSFKGFPLQVFLRQLASSTDDARTTARVLVEVLRPPRDSTDAHRKINDLAAEIQRIGTGRFLAPSYCAVLTSYFWALENPAEWPILWRPSAEFAEHCTGTALPHFLAPADRYRGLLEAVRELDDNSERFWRARNVWLGREFSDNAFLDPVLVDRCRFGLDRDIYPAALLANAGALVEVSWHLGHVLRDSVSEAAGLDLKYKKLPRLWGMSEKGRSDLWVDWRLPVVPKGPAIRVWVNHKGAAIGLRTSHLSQWTDLKDSLEALQPPGFEEFKVMRLSDLKSGDGDEHGPAGPDGDVTYEPLGGVSPRPGLHGFVGASGDLFYGKWYEPGELAGLDLRAEVVSVTEAAKPMIDRVMQEATRDRPGEVRSTGTRSGESEAFSKEDLLEDETVEDSLDARIEDLAEDLLLEGRGFLDDLVSLLGDKGQAILYGPPGTGKTYLARGLAEALAPDPDRRMLVQFHPSTSYEDFFEGYRPVTGDDGALSYRLTPGPLALLAEKAAADPGRRHVMVIDEINRANLPKVLGELLFLFEYRDESVRTLYRPDKPFRLPPNLWFVGTMNTADRSIALIDAALRRRFQFVPFFPDRGPASGLLERWLRANREPEWVGVLVDTVNDDLAHELGGSHLLLGASHFMKKGLDRQRLRQIWEYNVEPFIEDQFFGDPARIDRFRFDAVLRRYLEQTGDPSADPAGPAPDGLDETGPEPPTA